MRSRDESRAKYEGLKNTGRAVLETIRRNALLPPKALRIYEVLAEEGPHTVFSLKKKIDNISLIVLRAKLEYMRRFYKVLDLDAGQYKVNQTLPLDKKPPLTAEMTPYDYGFNDGFKACLRESYRLGIQFDRNHFLSFAQLLKGEDALKASLSLSSLLS